jgi:hypothetical protein
VTGVAGGLFDEMEENPPQVDPGMPWAMTSVQKVRPTYDLVGPGCPDAIGVDHLVRARTLLGMLQNDGVLLNDPPAPDCGCGGYRWGLVRGMAGAAAGRQRHIRKGRYQVPAAVTEFLKPGQ